MGLWAPEEVLLLCCATQRGFGWGDRGFAFISFWQGGLPPSPGVVVPCLPCVHCLTDDHFPVLVGCVFPFPSPTAALHELQRCKWHAAKVFSLRRDSPDAKDKKHTMTCKKHVHTLFLSVPTATLCEDVTVARAWHCKTASRVACCSLSESLFMFLQFCVMAMHVVIVLICFISHFVLNECFQSFGGPQVTELSEIDRCSAQDKLTLDRNRPTFRQVMSGFSRGCYNPLKLYLNEECVIRRAMGEPFHFTRPCAECYAKSATCGARHCKLQCLLNGVSKPCIQCVDRHCQPDTERCTGMYQHKGDL